MIIEKILVGIFKVNCYILASGPEQKAIIIDPGDEENKIRKVLDKHKLKPALVINTHGHIDHIGCDDKFGVTIYIHRDDLNLLSDAQMNLSSVLVFSYTVKSKMIKPLDDKDFIRLDDIELEVIHTPGHTQGGICLLMRKPANNVLFSGDTLFLESVGRADFPGADGNQLIESIRSRLLVLSDDTVVYPGHGPSSTIGRERKNNPFLG